MSNGAHLRGITPGQRRSDETSFLVNDRCVVCKHLFVANVCRKCVANVKSCLLQMSKRETNFTEYSEAKVKEVEVE